MLIIFNYCKFIDKYTYNYIFCYYSKVIVEFPTSNINNIIPSNHDGYDSQLIPGNICFGVYVALKMHQLKHEFKIPLLE